MKKAIQFMLLAALVVSVSGCANTNHPQAIRESSDIEALRSEIDENAVPKETLTDSFSESKTSSDDSVIDVKAETESSQAETPQPTAEQSPALGIQSPQTVVSNDTPKPESSKAVEPTTEPKPTPTQQPRADRRLVFTDHSVKGAHPPCVMRGEGVLFRKYMRRAEESAARPLERGVTFGK